jgi:hypothetical protein
MEAGTTVHFVTEGFDAAHARALDVAAGKGVDIAGGASTVRQALISGGPFGQLRLCVPVGHRRRAYPARC